MIVKTVPWWTDDELAELEKEAKNYDRLWRTMPELAKKVVVRFGGLYRSPENLRALVVKRGEPIREWKDIEECVTLLFFPRRFHHPLRPLSLSSFNLLFLSLLLSRSVL